MLCFPTIETPVTATYSVAEDQRLLDNIDAFKWMLIFWECILWGAHLTLGRCARDGGTLSPCTTAWVTTDYGDTQIP